MLYPHAPFTQKIRTALRKAITHHPKWTAYRKFEGPNLPYTNRMSRDQLFETCDKLGIDVPTVIAGSGARTGRRYRTGESNANYDKRTDAVLKLESLGYIYAGGQWQEKPDW